MAQFQEISSVQPRDPDLLEANRPRRFKHVNLPFLLSAAALVALGLVVQFSATSFNSDYSFSRQLSGVVLGLVLMALISRFDYHALSGFTTLFLVLNVVLLLAPHLPVIGMEAKGATSWIKIGPVSFQPGEFAKVTVVLMAASIMARYGGKLDDLREYLKVLAMLAVPFVCIMTQPDLGTGMVYLAIAAFALIAGGANWRFLVGTIAVLLGAVVAVFLLDPVFDSLAGHDVLLQDYQRKRLLVFLDPSYDTSGDGYNLRQAMIAIGSGGLFDKGYMQATQPTLGFLPEAPTDFVFCVFAEEFGFFGALVLLALYVALLVAVLRIARSSQDLFGTLVVCCIAGMWIFQILENIGMDIGLMPITGIPLPFMSYGSSFMVVNFVMLGLINSVWAHNGR